ncbi:hypothetical protein BS50DRAFT_682641 [Corynespora cassiicola Philippines]|uniref:SLC26A/SulP transporter domain-containing protein n=1 Tax=Corynespora cassiicola Philippines TaxID=1448308 RepID=A0A2T2N067_CORCC|nr:hypothetical protein BS50DRAFT_682641 [Corynespora cassiicola Philippines]
MTFGGSRLPGALGSMLVEVLPFLRAAALTIQRELGEDHPGLLPTVMATYALTSLLLGIMFCLLGLFRCGGLAAYFPQQVLTGIIGAVGISLCVLGLETTLPATSPPLRIENVGTLLFGVVHLPLLAVSFLPALFLTVSMHAKRVHSASRGLTKSPLYFPVFCLAVAVVFWIVIATTRSINAQKMQHLASTGWLFGKDSSIDRGYRIVDWNYWALFDFTKVQWRAIPAAADSIVPLVFIGAICLPIFVPPTAKALGMSHCGINYEIWGHAVSNVLAAATLTVPNQVVYVNSRFFFLAGGGQAEAALVAFFTLAFVFASPVILLYVPTILASMVVFFFGFELLIDSIWESSKSLVVGEWVTVLGTSIACSVLGFAPGIGIGLGIVMVLQLWHSTVSTHPRIVEPCRLQSHETPPENAYVLPPLHELLCFSPLEEIGAVQRKFRNGVPMQPVLIHLTGHVSFTTIPTMESVIERTLFSKSEIKCPYLILYFDRVTRVETCVAEFLRTKVWELARQPCTRYFIVTGVSQNSTTYADLMRARFDCWQDGEPAEMRPAMTGGGVESRSKVLAYEDLGESLHHCQSWVSDHNMRINGETLDDILQTQLLPGLSPELSNLLLPIESLVPRLESMKIRVRVRSGGDTLACCTYPLRPVLILLKGQLLLQHSHIKECEPSVWQSAVYDLARKLPRHAARNIRKRFSRLEVSEAHGALSRYLYAGESLGLSQDGSHDFGCIFAVSDSCWILDASAATPCGRAWAARMADLFLEQQANKRTFVGVLEQELKRPRR